MAQSFQEEDRRIDEVHTHAIERAGTIEDHMKLMRFIQWFGCDHVKINCGSRPKDIDQRRAEYCREMATGFNELGKRVTEMGMKFGIHAHLNSPFQIKEEVDRVMDLTDPKHVYFVCDTGHVTMAGMDPVQLTRTYVSRIIEYHITDTAPEPRAASPARSSSRTTLARTTASSSSSGRGASTSRPSRRCWTITPGRDGGRWSWIEPVPPPRRAAPSPRSTWRM